MNDGHSFPTEIREMWCAFPSRPDSFSAYLLLRIRPRHDVSPRLLDWLTCP